MPNYETLLAAAIDAAGEAGAILRRDFLQPGGPNAIDPDHAVADELAERLIRRWLLAAAPSFGYRGEETGDLAGSDPEHHLWLVDPNDGTAAYLRGIRGSAVSIALLRAGLPVLGIVFAFVAPDDDGDLFAWAEGCGSLTRNGRPAGRNASPEQGVTIVISPGAARPALDLPSIAPIRYLPAASIAYRLALVSAGEGEATVEPWPVQDWDYAAGHAMLRGSGGVLLDQDGREVTYTLSGESAVTRCFGGSPELAEALAREWS